MIFVAELTQKLFPDAKSPMQKALCTGGDGVVSQSLAIGVGGIPNMVEAEENGNPDWNGLGVATEYPAGSGG